MATEIAIFPLKDGKIPHDATSAAGQVLKDTLDTLLEQKGVQRAYWGTETENSGIFRLFVDWDSVDDHITFTKAEHYKPFLEHFGQIADINKAQLFHANLTPHPATEALSDHVSPATEILTVYFPQDYSQTDQDKFLEDIKTLVKAIEDNADTYTASAGGWVVEDIPIPDTSDNGKAYVTLIGWKSMEDHTAFTSTQAFKDNIHWLTEAKDIKHYSMVHYSGTQVQPGAGGVGDVDQPTAQEEVLNPQEGGKNPPKTKSDGTTTKNNDDLKGSANSNKKERQGRA